MATLKEADNVLGGLLNVAAVREGGMRGPYTIKELVFEEVGMEGNKEEKPVIYFKQINKGLVLNAARKEQLVTLFGEGDPAGQTVILDTARIRGQEQIVVKAAS